MLINRSALRTVPALVALVLTSVAPVAQATPAACTGTLTCYSGLDAGAASASTDPSDTANFPRTNATAAQTSFLGQLTNSRTQNFLESAIASGTTAVVDGLLANGNPLGASSASASGDQSAITDVTGADGFYTGRFNTTSNGSGRWAETDGSIGLVFTTPISSFGFFATDIGDFDGTLDLVLTLQNNGGLVELTNIVPTHAAGENGGLLFFGVVDSVNRFSAVSLVINQNPASTALDVVGFDDLTVGDLRPTDPNRVPEPGSLALAALGLLGAAAAARRRRG